MHSAILQFGDKTLRDGAKRIQRDGNPLTKAPVNYIQLRPQHLTRGRCAPAGPTASSRRAASRSRASAERGRYAWRRGAGSASAASLFRGHGWFVTALGRSTKTTTGAKWLQRQLNAVSYQSDTAEFGETVESELPGGSPAPT